MWELLHPGVQLWLTPHGPLAANSRANSAPRTTEFVVLAVARGQMPVFLHTHATNEVARRLIDGDRIEGLTGTRVLDTEVTVGRSRFDLRLRHRGQSILGEVKSVTLFGCGTAMFPDAPTIRGRRHLVELAGTARRGARPLVLFLAHTRSVRRFLPDYHTDLESAARCSSTATA